MDKLNQITQKRQYSHIDESDIVNPNCDIIKLGSIEMGKILSSMREEESKRFCQMMDTALEQLNQKKNSKK